MPNSDVTFCNLSEVASERFGDYAKMTFDFFYLLSIHGSLVQTDQFTNETGDFRQHDRMVAFKTHGQDKCRNRILKSIPGVLPRS
jgi:hypothetical protein